MRSKADNIIPKGGTGRYSDIMLMLLLKWEGKGGRVVSCVREGCDFLLKKL